MIQKSLWTYFIECYTKHYINFSGRARRREFWGFALYHTLIALIPASILFYYFFTFFAHLIENRPSNLDLSNFSAFDWTFLGLFSLFMIIYGFGTLLPSYAVLVRRFHDRGLSGKWILAYFIITQTIGIINVSIEDKRIGLLLHAISMGYSLCILAQCIMDSDPEDNRYGVNPKKQTETN